MNYQTLTKNYMLAVVIGGIACLCVAIFRLPLEKIDLNFLILVGATIGLGSRVTVQIPRFKSHISVSDTFIFLALLLYGGEYAVVLSAVEAFLSSWRFCSKKITIFFNAAAMAISTTCVVAVLKLSGLYTLEQMQGQGSYLKHFFVVLCVIAITQFIANTALAAMHDSLRHAVPAAEMWKNKYAWSFISYFVGAAGAGLLEQIYASIGYIAIIAALPIIYFVFLTYRMYLRNVEISIQQAEQANQYAKLLEDQSEELRKSEERFRSAFDHAPIGIALVSSGGRWLKVNYALCSILGYSEDEFLAMDFQSMISPDDLGTTIIKINELVSGKTVNCQMEQRYLHKSGATVWASWSVSAVTGSASNVSNLIFQIQDITGKKLAEEKLQHEATHDALTGLPNRSFFMNRLSAALKRSQEDPSYSVSVLFIDLDRFKNVNDGLGHLIGDQLLIGISERMLECMRPSDIVARLGGDEFTILVEGNYELAEVSRIAERIQKKFGIPFEIQGNEIYSSASIGILHASETHLTSEDMMRDADTAMYQAKRSGKARHEVFDDGMRSAVQETLQLETDLRRATRNNEIEVFYQPIFSLVDDRLYGLEALARWNHPTLGIISPSRFVPLAEEIGMIDVLGDAIMKLACRTMRNIQNRHEGLPDFKLSINLSSRQFADANLVERIRAILSESNFSPNRLKLEITETVFFEHHDRAIEMLEQLREMGVETDIDDFGTGYSNLGYLVRLPISALKIDRSFVMMMSENVANHEVIRAVISLAGNLGLKVVAEGIETEEQRDALRSLGCDFGQGYFYARPMCASNIETFLMNIRTDSLPPTQIADLSEFSTIQ